jgi:putative hydrolase of the HAD superfamily
VLCHTHGVPPSTSIKAVIFDVGGVLTSPLRETFEKIQAGGAVDLSKVGPQFRDTFMVGHDGDLPSHRLERGEISMNDFVATLGEARDAVWTLMHPDSPHSLFSHVTPHDGMHRLVDDARNAGYKTGIVSNIFTEYIPRWDEITNHVGRFDSVVYSCSVGVRKPNRAIFDIALAELDIEAHEALFIDDTPDMVSAARNYGFVSVEVDNHDSAIAEARRILAI